MRLPLVKVALNNPHVIPLPSKVFPPQNSINTQNHNCNFTLTIWALALKVIS